MTNSETTAPLTVEQIANVLSESLGETSDYQVAVKLHRMFAEAVAVPRLSGVLAEQQTRLEALRKAEGYANPRAPFAAFSATPEQRKGRALVEAAEWVIGNATGAKS